MTPGEDLPLSKSFEDDLDTGVTLTGSPTVTIYRKVSGSWEDKTADFTIANEQVNSAAIARSDGGTTPIGKGVSFSLTAATTEGHYSVELECGSSDGRTPKTNVDLIVTRDA